MDLVIAAAEPPECVAAKVDVAQLVRDKVKLQRKATVLTTRKIKVLSMYLVFNNIMLS